MHVVVGRNLGQTFQQVVTPLDFACASLCMRDYTLIENVFAKV